MARASLRDSPGGAHSLRLAPAGGTQASTCGARGVEGVSASSCGGGLVVGGAPSCRDAHPAGISAGPRGRGGFRGGTR